MPDPIGDAVEWIRDGGLLAYPTETVWGLGADARTGESLERLRSWKGRDPGEPMSILVEQISDLDALEFDVASQVRVVAEKFWPGPLTLVLPCRRQFGPGIARADGAVGVRCSAHPLAAAIARRLREEGVGPITATSLNRSGEPPASTRVEAERVCGDDLETPRLIHVCTAESAGEEASTVVDATQLPLRVLRQGAVKASELEPWLGDPS
jgi:L-threonylcarbamoyladenylate synthase